MDTKEYQDKLQAGLEGMGWELKGISKAGIATEWVLADRGSEYIVKFFDFQDGKFTFSLARSISSRPTVISKHRPSFSDPEFELNVTRSTAPLGSMDLLMGAQDPVGLSKRVKRLIMEGSLRNANS